MKRIILLFFLLPFIAWATPEKILPKTLVLKPVSWYHQKATEWAAEVKSNPSGEAWFNYYAASVFAQEGHQSLDSHR
ncbi:MAG: hypothetical protein QM734_16060 [Cyclobacteriaceae bacterium]